MERGASDEALVLAARDGSATAFQALVARHQQGVRSFLRRLCDEPADADDIAQDTFLAAWSGLWRFDGRSSFRSWLCAIAWRKRLSAERSRRRSRRREGAYQPPPTLQGGLEGGIDVKAALASLPVEQRAVVALCLGADFSHAEAAQALSMPLGTIKSHVQRGRAKLMAALGDDHE